jgi:hypothetical protein
MALDGSTVRRSGEEVVVIRGELVRLMAPPRTLLGAGAVPRNAEMYRYIINTLPERMAMPLQVSHAEVVFTGMSQLFRAHN